MAKVTDESNAVPSTPTKPVCRRTDQAYVGGNGARQMGKRVEPQAMHLHVGLARVVHTRAEEKIAVWCAWLEGGGLGVVWKLCG